MKKIYSKIIISAFVLFVQTAFWSCSKDNSTEEEPDPDPKVEKSLTVDVSSLYFQNEGSSQDIIITTDVDTWVISSSGTSWITLSKTTGSSGATNVTVTVSKNTSSGIADRSSTITINANGITPVKIPVTQDGLPSTNGIFPDYNMDPIPADETGMTDNAVTLASKMTLGWNIGNTFEAPGGETGWGSPLITERYIKFVKQNGFNAIRIPCSWDMHANNETAEIDAAWLNRVKEVVQYCTDNDLYVILNIHWDNGWLESGFDTNGEEEINLVDAKQKAYWEQIATTMRDFDGKVMFASANEPAVDNAENMTTLLRYHQTFVDAVRSTGGKNAYRVLVLQGPTTSTEHTFNLMNTLPTDTVPDKFIIEIHNYTPFQFTALEEDVDWGDMFYYWGADYHSVIEPERNSTWGDESFIEAEFQKMKTKFVDNGIPVIMGEYGAYRRGESANVPLDLDTHNDAIDYWLTFNTQKALEYGIIPFFWETGSILDRSSDVVKDQRTIDALIAGSK